MNLTSLVLAWICAAADPVPAADSPQTLLFVRTTPCGAEVRLDGQLLGRSDGLFPVNAGTYKMVVDLEGYQPGEQQIAVRDGRITRIEITLQPKAGGAGKLALSQVIEGVGWGEFRVGATREALVKAAGPPEPNPTAGSAWVRWLRRYHVDCLFDEHGGAREIRFNKGFGASLASGIRIGSSEKEVLAAYGKPNRVLDNTQARLFEWSDRGLLLWLKGGKVFDFTVFKPHKPLTAERTQPSPTPENPLPDKLLSAKVVEGVGWNEFRVGATREDLMKTFGPPEPNPIPGSLWVQWLSRYHVDCLLDKSGGAMEVRFNKGFPSSLASGITIGSSEKEVLSAYGKPNHIVDNGAAKMFEWSGRGVLLWVNDGRVSDFTVFKPYNPGGASPANGSP